MTEGSKKNNSSRKKKKSDIEPENKKKVPAENYSSDSGNKKSPMKKSPSSGKKTSGSNAGKTSTPEKLTTKKKTAGSSKSKNTSSKKKSSAKSVKSSSKSAKKNSSSLKKTGSAKKKSAVDKKNTPGRRVQNKSSKIAAQSKKTKKTEEKNPVKKEDIDPYELEAIERGDNPMTVVEHLEEFRYRLLVCLTALVVVTIGAFFMSEYILDFISEPFRKSGHQLNIFELTGGFFIKLKASAITAFIVTMPLLVYHFWRYISPAISISERKISRRVVFAGVLLFYTGAAFVFFAVLPFSINILLGFIDGNMHTTIGADDYLNFIFMFCIAMGVVFELPVIVMLLTKAGILTPRFLISKRKYAVVLA
ncbi:MAG: twin-arginine translocase subunit TatC, partial [bacterium]